MALEAGLIALAATGANTVVTAMATDAWNSIRSGFARLLGRGDAEATAEVERQLEEARRELERLDGAARDQATADRRAAWRAALADLLASDPQAASLLTDFLTMAGASPPSQSAGSIRQNAVATGDAQQVVQGSGTQSITFGKG